MLRYVALQLRKVSSVRHKTAGKKGSTNGQYRNERENWGTFFLFFTYIGNRYMGITHCTVTIFQYSNVWTLNVITLSFYLFFSVDCCPYFLWYKSVKLLTD